MSKLRMSVLIVVLGAVQGAPAFAQISGGTAPGPEVGAGVIGMSLAVGAYKVMRRRLSR